jgi:hypothetical protein
MMIWQVTVEMTVWRTWPTEVEVVAASPGAPARLAARPVARACAAMSVEVGAHSWAISTDGERVTER